MKKQVIYDHCGYENFLRRCSYLDLIEIEHNLNEWKWDSRLGEKPNNWDSMFEIIHIIYQQNIK